MAAQTRPRASSHPGGRSWPRAQIALGDELLVAVQHESAREAELVLDDAAIDAFVSRGARQGVHADDLAYLPGGRLQSYGGEIGAVGQPDTAFDHRDALVEFVAGAGWSGPAEDERRISAARTYGAAMALFASGVYVNDLGDEGEAGVRRAYGAAKMARLAELKGRYDPDNVFHLNHNIRPRVGGGGP